MAEEPLVRAITVTGTLAAEDQVALGFKVAGRVAEVDVDLGSIVKQGQVVARLIPTDYELRVRQAEAALVQARVRLGLPAEGERRFGRSREDGSRASAAAPSHARRA